jgi:DNA polymerase-3 subunit delta
VAVTKVLWSAARPAPVVLLAGPADALADRALSMIRDELAAASVEIHDLDAADYAAGELITMASPSLFGDPRLIRITHVEQANDAFITDAKAYLDAPDSETTAVFRHRGGQRGKAVLDKIRKQPASIEIECKEVSERERPAFISAEFQRLGAKISPSAVRMLASAYSEDLAELASVCEQLVRDCGATIRDAQVEQLTEGRVETTAFKVADAACAGRQADAIILLRHALSTGAKPMQLLGALNMKVRAMARVTGARGQISGMQGWQIERARREARGWSEDALADLIDSAAETEWQLKGGASQPEYALERYVLQIAKRGH